MRRLVFLLVLLTGCGIRGEKTAPDSTPKDIIGTWSSLGTGCEEILTLTKGKTFSWSDCGQYQGTYDLHDEHRTIEFIFSSKPAETARIWVDDKFMVLSRNKGARRYTKVPSQGGRL